MKYAVYLIVMTIMLFASIHGAISQDTFFICLTLYNISMWTSLEKEEK